MYICILFFINYFFLVVKRSLRIHLSVKIGGFIKEKYGYEKRFSELF